MLYKTVLTLKIHSSGRRNVHQPACLYAIIFNNSRTTSHRKKKKEGNEGREYKIILFES